MDKTLFSGTHKFYSDFRPGIPSEVVKAISDFFSLKSDDHVLDLGCGTGQVAFAFSDFCEGYTGLDPDCYLLEEAKRTTKKISNKIDLEWFHSSAEDIPSLYHKLGEYKIVTFARSFHWMDKERVLKCIKPMVLPDGGIAIISDGSLWAGVETWQAIVKRIIQKYLGEKRKAGQGTFKESNEPWEDLIQRSPFGEVHVERIPVKREWTSDGIVGWLYSSTFAKPAYFGKNVGKFENEVRTALKKLNTQEVFLEYANFEIIMGKCNQSK